MPDEPAGPHRSAVMRCSAENVDGPGDDEDHHGVGDQRLDGHKALARRVSGIVSVGLTAIALVSDT